MAVLTWKGVSGDWTASADWSGGAPPGAADTAVFTGAGAYTVTLYSAAAVGGVLLDAASALLYDAGALTLGGVFTLQAGTFALADGTLNGGALALAGGILAAEGGTLNGVKVDGTLSLAGADAALNVAGGLAMAGAGGSGQGSVTLTGQYAALDFLGSQLLANAVVSFGASGPGPGQGGAAVMQVAEQAGAGAGATLTLGSNVWLRETGQAGQLIIGAGGTSPYTDQITNNGTITDALAGSTLVLSGPGDFVNAGTLAISNGATLDIACGGFSDTGVLSVSDATLDFGGTFASGALAVLQSAVLAGATVEIGGIAQNAGATLSVGGTGALGSVLLAGTIAGGTVADSGGGLNFSAGTGALDGVTYLGTLTLGAGAAVTLLDSTSVTAASITGAGAALYLQGQTVLDNARISLGGAGSGALLATSDAWLAAQATTATLGAHLTLVQNGLDATIGAEGTTPFPGFGLDDTLVNAGSIQGSVAGGTLAISGAGTFINQGSISIGNGDTLLAQTALFSNTGTIAISNGATAVLGGPANVFGVAPLWSNSGLISVSGATLDLAGALATAQLGSITANSGTLVLSGTLSNGGATLALGTGNAFPALTLTGTIMGGAITDPQGVLSINAADTALLSGVSDTGTLALNQAGAALRIQNGLSLHGTALVIGAGAALDFQGSQSFNSGTIALGAAGSAAMIDTLPAGTAAGATLTLGAAVQLLQTGALAALGAADDAAGSAIINLGTITAAAAGGELALQGGSFVNRGSIAVSNGDTLLLAGGGFANTGTLAVTNATLDIDEAVVLSALGHLGLTDAAVSVGGTLALGGGTLDIGAGTGFGRLALSGTIAGGTLNDAGQGIAAQGGTLSGVTYQGVLDLSRPFQALSIANGLTLTDETGTQAGSILLTGAASRLLAASSETLADMTIYLGSATGSYQGQRVAPAELAAEAGTTLTLAANTLVRSAGAVGMLGDSAAGNWRDTIVNAGTVLEATAGGVLTIGASDFVNQGGIVIGNGGNIVFGGVQLTNQAQISVAAGSQFGFSLLGYYAAPDAGAQQFTNTGTVRLLGGLVNEYTGNGLFPSVPLVNAAGGAVIGFGGILAPVVNQGTITAEYGPNLDITGPVSGSGTLELIAASVLELGGAVSSGQSVDFTASGETLRLDAPASFAGTVTNFTSGDGIDLTGTPVNTVAISSGTLVLGTGYGVFKLADTAALGGEISAGNDHHGGTLVTYTQQSAGGTAAVIGVSQPKMLFWASPVGDEFQGASANLAGATIANWTGADSLDFIDFLGTKTTVSYVQASGQGTITVTDGNVSASVTLLGSYTASWFHVGADSQGYAQITYKAH